MQPHRSSASLLTALYVLLVLYASLYPFNAWRDQGLNALEFLTAPWPLYWGQFDTAANFAGYVPLGFLATLAMLRTSLRPWPVLWVTLAAAALSLTMEALQTYLPQRVPALSDWLLNCGGALLGAWLARSLEALGVIDHWSRFRRRWFTRDARSPLVLLATWPVALLFPPAVPLGLGQIFERVEAALEATLAHTPFLAWLPVRGQDLQPMAPLGELLCVALGLLAPCLLGYAHIQGSMRRAAFFVAVCAIAISSSSLSAALSYGPEYAWGWVSKPVWFGLCTGAALALLCLSLRRRTCLALLLVVLAWQLSLVNLAPSTPYFAQTLQSWEQGRFIRFHGLAQWIGWVWPYVALLLALVKLSQRETPRE
ncbi:MAG: VanZ family protein [Burkholderiaceae bacterium]